MTAWHGAQTPHIPFGSALKQARMQQEQKTRAMEIQLLNEQSNNELLRLNSCRIKDGESSVHECEDMKMKRVEKDEEIESLRDEICELEEVRKDEAADETREIQRKMECEIAEATKKLDTVKNNTLKIKKREADIKNILHEKEVQINILEKLATDSE